VIKSNYSHKSISRSYKYRD